MKIRGVLKVIGVLVVLHTVLAVGFWWAMTPASVGTTPEPVVAGSATSGTERLAELYAKAAFRAVITADYAALGEMVKQANSWSEIVYVSVEDARGMILAHTDRTKVGRLWDDRVAKEIRATVKLPYEEVAAEISDQAGGTQTGGRVGRVRLGYLSDANAAPPARPISRAVPLPAVLALAVLAAISGGLLVTMLAPRQPRRAPVPRDLQPVGPDFLSGAPAAQRELDALRLEVETLRPTLAQRTAELADVRADLRARMAEVAQVRDVLADLTAEVERRDHERAEQQSIIARREQDLGTAADALRADLAARTAELASVQADLDVQLAAAAQLRDTLERQTEETERLQRERADQEAIVARLEEQVDRHRAQYAELQADRAQLSSGLVDVREAVQRLAREAGERTRELAGVQSELALRTAEARRLEAALVRARGDRSAAEESNLRQFHTALASIAHVFRTSLTNVLGFSKVLLRGTDGPLNDSQVTDVLTIQRAGTQLLTFVTGLSELARLDAEAVVTRPEAIDIAGFLQEAAASLESTSPIEVKVECPEDLPRLMADRSHVAQIVQTLIQQAASLSGSGEVVLSAGASAATVSLVVGHPGRSIAAEELATFLAPFPPPRPGGPVQNDAGRLRLAVARRLAQVNGGDLTVDSRGETGVLFIVTMPVAAAPDVPTTV